MDEPIEQRSDEWHQQRAGKITASRFADAMDITEPEPGAIYKSGPRKGQPKLPESTAKREKYKRELAFERLALTARHEISGHALRYGTEVEAFAREAYELETGNIVLPAAFVTHPDYPFIGASADGLIGLDGGYESKCPMDEAVHIQTWLEGMPDEHKFQVQGGMFVTGRKWWDFVSYDPRQCDRLRLYLERINRDDVFIAKMRVGLLQFNAEVDAMVQLLLEKAA